MITRLKHNELFKRRYYKLALGITLFVVFASGCERPKKPTIIYQPFFNNIFAKAAALQNNAAAINYINQAFNGTVMPAKGDLINKYNNLSDYNSLVGNAEKALIYLDSTVAILNNSKDDPLYSMLYAKTYLAKGQILIAAKKYNEAYQAFYLAKAAIQDKTSCEYQSVLSSITSRLGSISYTQHRYSRAIDLFKSTVAQLSDCTTGYQQFMIVQGNLDNVGLSFAHDGKPDSALIYYNNALDFIKQNKSKYPDKDTLIQLSAGIIYDNRAQSYAMLNQDSLAKADFRKSIAINARKGFSEGDAAYSALGLGALYLKIHNTDSTKILLDGIKRYNETQLNKDTASVMRYLKLNADYLRAVKDFKGANENLEAYLQARARAQESLNNLNKTDFANDFEALDQQYRVIALNRQSQLKTLYLIGSIVVCLLCIIIIIIFIRNRNQSKVIIRSMDNYNSQLRLAINSLEQRNKDFSNLINILGHDLKNPMTAIGNTAELLLLKDWEEEEKELIELIKSSSRNLIMIIDDLVQVGDSSPLGDTALELIDLEELLINSVALMKQLAMEKGQAINLTTIGEVFVKINREKVYRVINNLIVNAVKFSKPDAAIEISMHRANGRVEIRVQDKGIGVPDKLKDKLFDLFTDAKRKGTAGEQSFGLGLHNSRQIMQSQKGKIWFESTENEGTTFYLSFAEVVKK